MPPLFIILLFFVLNTITTTNAINTNHPFTGSDRDYHALLAIRSKIILDPHGILNSWNESAHICKWEGVKCGHRHKRVTTLDLSSYGLVGSLSPSVGNLSFLHDLILYNNSFTGDIPPEVGRLIRLKTLVLATNSFQGEIPTNISGCRQLNVLFLSNNTLIGKLPSGLSFLSKLEYMALNREGGPGFSGKIPDFIGNFKDLTQLVLGDNSFTGQIPPSLYNLSNLQSFILAENLLEGVLPTNLGLYFPQLQWLQLFDNHFSGRIPSSLSNLSNLENLDIRNNNFTGKITFDGRKMPNLLVFDLGNTITGRGDIDELAFLNTLVNCTYLQRLNVYENNLGGNIPPPIANLSIHIQTLDLHSNLISGSIPFGLGNILGMWKLLLYNNQLTGSIPLDVANLSKLQTLALYDNLLSGKIPSYLGNLSLLSKLYLEGNNLQGTVPASLGNCKNLMIVYLQDNNLVGNVPHELFQASSLILIDLSRNKFQGSVPSEIGDLRNLFILDMSNNNLSGHIPSSLGQCVALSLLALEGNSFIGSIPPSFSSLKDLQSLDLSSNKLVGQVPKYLSKFSSLTYLNLSFNNLEGDVPTTGIFANASAISLTGNKLCGGIPQLKLPPCQMVESKSRRKLYAHVIAISVSCFLVGLTTVSVVYFLCTRRKRKAASSESPNKEPFIKVSYDMLLKATNGFSPANLIGSGSFSSVYKGTIQIDGAPQDVAVKVINNQQRGASRSFLAECEALRIVRHRNLVRVITACSSIDFQGNVFKALVYEFMSKGNPDQWLHQFQNLRLLQRLNIALDIAHALDYIHNGNDTSIIHCDLKPTNILLDENLTAHVGDLGLVKLIPEISEQLFNSSSIGVRGTIGYVAPEYGYGTSVSTAGDVYSYGIILLEIMTGKKPIDSMFEGDMSLHKFAELVLPDHVLEIVDPILLTVDDDKESNTDLNHTRMVPECVFQCITTMITIGVRCSSELPSVRMDIKDVLRQLQSQKDHLNLCERYHRCERVL